MDNLQQQNMGPTPGEISTIRNILMGNHMAEYSSKFKEIQDTFDANDKDKDERFLKLEADMTNRFYQLEQKMNARFDKLEALLTENVQRLHERVNVVSVTDKADLGRLLAEVSNRLING
jgi:hypothetical protein